MFGSSRKWVRKAGCFDDVLCFVRAFYSDKKGFRPENVGVIRLREEDVDEVVAHDASNLEELERLAGNL